MAVVLPTAVVDEQDVEGVDVAWEVSEDGEDDVDQEIGVAAGDEEDSDGGDCFESEESLVSG